MKGHMFLSVQYDEGARRDFERGRGDMLPSSEQGCTCSINETVTLDYDARTKMLKAKGHDINMEFYGVHSFTVTAS